MLNSSSRNPLGSKSPRPAREIFTETFDLNSPTCRTEVSLLSLKKRKETHLKQTEEKGSRSIGSKVSEIEATFWQYCYCYHEIFITLHRIRRNKIHIYAIR